MSVTNVRIACSSDEIARLCERNKCLRRLFLYDAREMLCSVLCADECSLVWPYLQYDKEDYEMPDKIEELRIVHAEIVDERQLRVVGSSTDEQTGLDTDDQRKRRACKRRRLDQH